MADLFYQYVDRRVLSLANTRQCTGNASFICATFWGIIKEQWLALGANPLLKHLSFFFIPIAGGDPAIAVAFVVFTGTLGSIIGPSLLSSCKITNPIARGLAMGVTSHGQGTATILQEGALQGAMAGVAMAVAAIFISFIAPIYIPWLVHL